MACDPEMEEIKREHFESIRKREAVMIVRGDYGWQVHHWFGEPEQGVAPQTDYDTPQEAAARVLQLLKIKEPVKPQDWPESVCIGSINGKPVTD